MACQSPAALLLQAELSKLDRDIDGAIRKSPAWQADADLLASAPGIGKAALRTLIAEPPELGRLDRRKIANLVLLLGRMTAEDRRVFDRVDEG